MFDTVAISSTFARSPNTALLERNGCKPFFSQYTGEPYKLVLNGEPGAKEPRLTILKSPKELWILRAEISVGGWLFGSNLSLPNDDDMQTFFQMLSDYVGTMTGIKFNAQIERVVRADFTRDFQLDESKVLAVLSELRNTKLAKYHTRPFDETTVYFDGKGKKLSKRYKVYSKFHEIADREEIHAESNLAKGILRLEVEHRTNKAVSNLAKSLKLPNHNSDSILTRETYEKVIEKSMRLLQLESLLKNDDSKLERLGQTFDTLTALKYAGHLLYKSKYGIDYGKLPFINLSKNTIKNYDRECAKAGILSLE